MSESNNLITIILILGVVVLALIAMYLFGFFGKTKIEVKSKIVDTSSASSSEQPVVLKAVEPPVVVAPPVVVTPPTVASDYRPFNELSEAIEPSILPMAKEDYNNLILKFFYVLNKQSKKLDLNSINEMSDTSIMVQMIPYIMDLQKKYTPPVAGKLLKYFACKNLTGLLNNYYTGPPINIVVPAYSMLGIDSFPFTYTSKSKGKVVNASTLAPFKYIAYNIPYEIKTEVTQLYDNLIDKYMNAINEIVAPLSEVNMQTIMTINPMTIMQKYQPMMMQDLMLIQQIFGSNVVIIIKSLIKENLVPLLDRFYKGPGIDISSPLPPNPFLNNQTINLVYPNADKNNIFTITPTNSSSAGSTTSSSVSSTSTPITTTSSSSSSSKSA
jgi:hypothetical protein